MAAADWLVFLAFTATARNFRSLRLTQSTFYRLPSLETAKRWRGEVQKEFEFTVKAFQGVTHPSSSPTWRKAGSQGPKENLGNYGHLQRTEETLSSWDR